MANWSDIVFSPTQTDYIARLELLRTRSQAVATEVENARDGEASVLARIQKCMVMSFGFTQDISANNNRLRNLPTPIYADEPATKQFAEGLAFAAALPAQAGSAGMGVVTDGVTARWGISNAEAMAILHFINY